MTRKPKSQGFHSNIADERRRIQELREFLDLQTGYDLRLISWGDGSGVSTPGHDLVLVGVDNHGLLRIRIFDAAGNRITDTDETKLPLTRTGAISTLEQRLPGSLPPHALTSAEKAQVLKDVTSNVGRPPKPNEISWFG